MFKEQYGSVQLYNFLFIFFLSGAYGCAVAGADRKGIDLLLKILVCISVLYLFYILQNSGLCTVFKLTVKFKENA
jgi:hypothetical protein